MPGDIKDSRVTMPGWPTQQPERAQPTAAAAGEPKPREGAAEERRKSLTNSASAPPVVSGSMASEAKASRRQGGDGRHKEHSSKVEGDTTAALDPTPKELLPEPSPSTSREAARLEAERFEAAALEKYHLEQVRGRGD